MLRLFVALFYADDGYIASRDPELLDRALEIIVGLFERVGLRTNTSKTETMICTPGKIRTRLSASSYYRRYAGFSDAKGWASRKVECDKCGKVMKASSLEGHMETQHGVYCSSVVPEEYLQPPDGGKRYRASKSLADGKYYCPVPGCIGEAGTKWGMRRHFSLRHPHDWVIPDGEVCYDKCGNCGM